MDACVKYITPSIGLVAALGWSSFPKSRLWTSGPLISGKLSPE
jgi:hypothetical protein